MKNKRILLALLALALAVATVLPAAMAYFTTNAQATGSRPLKLGGSTTIEEKMAGWVKEITISANADSQPMWVRARAYPEALASITGEGGWVDGKDGWWYFTTPLANPQTGDAKTQTTVLKAEVIPVKVEEVGQIPDGFDVTVVYESAPVLYGTDGERLPYQDAWSAEAVTPPAGT